MAAPASLPPRPSPLSNLITTSTSSLPYATSSLLALPLEILHNLQYQHSWKSLSLHYIHPTTSKVHRLDLSSTAESTPNIPPATSHFLISGLPPRHAYVHPDLQTRLLKQGLTQKDVFIQREWVIPLSLGQKQNLAFLAGIFDALPPREKVVIAKQHSGEDADDDDDDDVTEDGKSSLESRTNGEVGPGHENPKRVLLAMKAQDGLGGDGTVAYYVCLEGEVKPRQNG